MTAWARLSKENAIEYLREEAGFVIEGTTVHVHRALTQYEQRTINYLIREHGFSKKAKM